MTSSSVDPSAFLDSLFDDAGMFEFDEQVSQSPGAEGRSLSLNGDDDVHFGSVGAASSDVGALALLEDSWVPREGMIVESVIEGFIKYSEYSRRTGFEIRFRSSERCRKADGTGGEGGRVKKMKRGIARNWFYGDYEFCSRVRLECVKGGRCRPNRRNPNRPVRSQLCGCKAGVVLLKNGDGTWIFRKVNLEHNHACEASNCRFMKNYRLVSGVDEIQMVNADRAGVTPSRIYSTFVVGHGGYENVPFSMKDFQSVLRRSRLKSLENGDFNAMQNLFNEMKGLSKEFCYMYDTDEDGRVCSVFWADARSRAAYKDFGDVVSFDTTHLKNRYKMPLAPFIGVNHHGQSILLGCALITNEDTESFKWVFESWMECMERRAPMYIMTDQCQAIGNAVAIVFPNSRHRWCLWHIMRNAEKNLKRLEGWEDILRTMQEVVHDSCSPGEFEDMWLNFIEGYCLGDNDWLRCMYDVREKWVPAFFLDQFWAGMHSTQRSEGMNNFFRSYVNINTCLRQFAEQYCLIVGKRVDDEERENWKSFNKPALCATRFRCEHILQKLYTVNKFLEVQNEAKGVAYTKLDVLSVEGVLRTYNVTDRGVEKACGGVRNKEYMVEYDMESNITNCECKRFSFRGIICRHMIAVWQEEELKFIPQRYIVDRWRKDKFRECSRIKIPKYSLVVDKSVEFRKIEKLEGIMREIANLAMGSEELFSSLISGLEIVKDKCHEFVVDTADVSIDSVGRVYKKHRNVSGDDVVPNLSIQCVLDPVDRRGRGRVPVRRKSYRADKRKKPHVGGNVEACSQPLDTVTLSQFQAEGTNVGGLRYTLDLNVEGQQTDELVFHA